MAKKLNQLEATAICGNDISSSCLYVSALAILYAGQYAWLSLLIVAGILFLFRKIYGEVVGALPLNGGAYNALLNTTRKSTASLKELSIRWKIPTNFLFIGAPSDRFPHKIQTLGEVRLII